MFLRSWWAILVFVFALCLSWTAFADDPITIYVAVTGDDQTGNGSESNPYKTIQKGIDEASNGDTVIVKNGYYAGSGNRNLDFNGKAITVKSQNGADNCIIHCQDDGRGFYFHNSETSTSVVDGFTIKDGDATGYTGPNYAGAIYCISASPTIKNCIFDSNYAKYYGGAIYYKSSSNPTISNCTFKNNTAKNMGSGGAIYANESSGTIENCIFKDNEARRAGAIFLRHSDPDITNCTITNNDAILVAGGIYCFGSGSSPTFTNCTITDNSVTDNDGGGVFCYTDTTPTLNNCIIWGNTAGGNGHQFDVQDADSTVTLNYCCYSNGTNDVTGDGTVTPSNCVNSDPLFAGLGDYHLQPGSPCIDAGNNSAVPGGLSEDFDGDSRIIDGDDDQTATVDIGVDEVTGVNVTPNAPVGVVYWNELYYSDQYDEVPDLIFNPENPTPGFVRAKATDNDESDTFEFCQVQIADSQNFAPADIMWDSGKAPFTVALDQDALWPDEFLQHAGEPFESEATAYVRVRIWDNNQAVSAWSTVESIEFDAFEEDPFSSQSLSAVWGVFQEDLYSPENVYLPVHSTIDLHYRLSGWVNKSYDTATVVSLIDMHNDSALSGELWEEGHYVSIVAAYPDVGEAPSGYWYWIDASIDIYYHCLDEGTDEVSVSVFFKEGFNEIPLPGPNEIAVAWTSSGEDPFDYPDPTLFDWLDDNGFGLELTLASFMQNATTEIPVRVFIIDDIGASTAGTTTLDSGGQWATPTSTYMMGGTSGLFKYFGKPSTQAVQAIINTITKASSDIYEQRGIKFVLDSFKFNGTTPQQFIVTWDVDNLSYILPNAAPFVEDPYTRPHIKDCPISQIFTTTPTEKAGWIEVDNNGGKTVNYKLLSGVTYVATSWSYNVALLLVGTVNAYAEQTTALIEDDDLMAEWTQRSLYLFIPKKLSVSSAGANETVGIANRRDVGVIIDEGNLGGTSGFVILGHEFGHNLDLGHVTVPANNTNVMNPEVSTSNTDLTEDQGSTAVRTWNGFSYEMWKKR